MLQYNVFHTIFLSYLNQKTLEYQEAALPVRSQVTELTWQLDPSSPCSLSWGLVLGSLVASILTNIPEFNLVFFSNNSCNFLSSSVSCHYGQNKIAKITTRCRSKCSYKINMTLSTDTDILMEQFVPGETPWTFQCLLC